MRIFYIILLATAFYQVSNAQVGVGTQTPNASAQLDVTAVNKGFLPPRMTTVQRNGIASPSQGLIIFNTDTQSLELYTVYGWYGIQLQLPVRKLLGGGSGEEVTSIRQTTDGGFIIAGSTFSSASGDVTSTNHDPINGTADYWIVKLDADRTIAWTKLFGGDLTEIVSSIQQTSDGGYIIAGYSNSSANGNISGTNHGATDYWIVKLDDLGRIEWEKLIGGIGSEYARSVVQTTDGGFIVGGYSNSSSNGDITEETHGGFDYWIVKLDASGEITWDKLLGGAGNEELNDIIQATDGNYVIAGYSSSSQSGNVSQENHGTFFPDDFWIVRISNTGVILWNKLLGGTGDDKAFSIHQTTGDGYIIAGSSTSSANGDVTGTNHGSSASPDYWIVRLDRFGNISWNKLLGGINHDEAYSARQTSDGGYIVAGYTSSSMHGDVTGPNHGTQDYWIVKLDANGNTSWNQVFGGSAEEVAFNVRQTSDGGFIIAGSSRSSLSGDVTGGNHGNKDIWVIKVGSNGYLY